MMRHLTRVKCLLLLALAALLAACGPTPPVPAPTGLAAQPAASLTPAAPTATQVRLPTWTPFVEPRIDSPTPTPQPSLQLVKEVSVVAPIYHSAVWSPDGTRLAVVNETGIDLYNAASLEPLAHLDFPGTKFDTYLNWDDRKVLFSPSGARLAYYYINHLAVWDTATYELVAEFDDEYWSTHLAFVGENNIAFMDVQEISRRSYASSIRLRRLPEGSLAVLLPGSASDPSTNPADLTYHKALAASPDGSLIAAAGESHVIYVWDTRSGQRQTLAGHTATVNHLAFSPDGRRLASGGEDAALRIWDMPTRSLVTEVQSFPNDLGKLQFSHDGKQVFVRIKGQPGVWIYDASGGQPLGKLDFPNEPGAAVPQVSAVRPDGGQFAASDGLSLFLVDPVRGRVVHTFSGVYRIRPNAEDINWSASFDGRHIAITDRYARPPGFQVIDLEFDLRADFRFGTGNCCLGTDSFSFSSDGYTLYMAAGTGIYRLDLQEGGLELLASTPAFSVVAGSQASQLLWSDRSHLFQYSLAQASVTADLPGVDLGGARAVLSPDGSTVALITWRDVLQIIDLETGSLVEEFTEFSRLDSMAFMDSDHLLIAARQWGGIRLQVIQTRSPSGRLPGAGLRRWEIASIDETGNVQLSADGRLLMVEQAGNLSFYAAANGQQVASAALDKDPVAEADEEGYAVLLSGDGRKVIVQRKDPPRTIEVWDAGPVYQAAADLTPPSWTALLPGEYTLSAPELPAVTPDASLASLPVPQPAPEAIGPHNAASIVQTAEFGSGLISQVAWSPDGKLVAAAAQRGVFLFSPPDFTPAGQSLTDAPVSGLAFSRNGRYLAACTSDGQVALWELPAWRQVFTRAGHRGCSHLAFSPDSSYIALSVSYEVRLLAFLTGEHIRTLEGAGSRQPLFFSPDSSLLWTTGSGNELRAWQVETGLVAGSMGPASSNAFAFLIEDLAFSRDGRYAADFRADSQLRIYDSASRRVALTLPIRPVVENTEGEWSQGAVAFSPDGKTLAASGHEDQIRLFQIPGGVEKPPLEGQPVQVKQLAFHPNGSSLLALDQAGALKLWDLSTRRLRGQLLSQPGQLSFLGFSGDGAIQSAWGDIGAVFGLPSAPAQPVHEAWRGRLLALSPDGSLAAVYDRLQGPGGKMELWSIPGGSQIMELAGAARFGARGAFEWASFSPDNRLLFACGEYACQVWDTETGQIRLDLGNPYSTTCSPSLSRCLAAGFSRGLEVFDLAQTRPSVLIPRLRADIIALHPDGVHMAYSDRRQVYLVNLLSGDILYSRPLLALDLHSMGIFDEPAFSFSPNGTVLAAGSRSGVLYLFNAADLTLLAEIPAHAGRITRLAFSPDGASLATTGIDGLIKVWGVP